jgi:hypothetical protein
MEDADIVKIVVKQAINDETIPLLLINVDGISVTASTSLVLGLRSIKSRPLRQ